MRHLLVACRSSYTGIKPADVARTAYEGLMQIWRVGDQDGIVLTQIHQHPGGRELFVVALAGEHMIRNIYRVYSDLAAYAAVQDCKWVTGLVPREGLQMLYERDLKADTSTRFAMFDVPEVADVAAGLEPKVKVQTPGGAARLRDLEIGDKVLGPNGEQTIKSIKQVLIGHVTTNGLGVEQRVMSDEGEWTRADHLFNKAEPGPALVYEIEVTPDHIFNLEDGTTVHNGGGGGGDTKVVEKDTEPFGPAKPFIRSLFDRANQAFGLAVGADPRAAGGAQPSSGGGGQPEPNVPFLGSPVFGGFPLGPLGGGGGGSGAFPQLPLFAAAQQNQGGGGGGSAPAQDFAFGDPVRNVINQGFEAAERAGVGSELLRQNAIETARGDFLDPASNPFLRDAIAASIDPIQENFERQVLPSIDDAALSQGAFGGSRQGVAEAIAAEELNEQVGNLTSQLVFDNFVRERQNQLDAGRLFQNANALASQPLDILQQTQRAAFTPVREFANAIAPGTGFTSTTTEQSGGRSDFASFAQGALGGAASGAATGAAVGSAGGPFGATGGAVAGGIIGGLGSIL